MQQRFFDLATIGVRTAAAQTGPDEEKPSPDTKSKKKRK